MRTRNNDWVNTDTLETKFGIDVSYDGKNWNHLAINSNPYFATNEKERNEKRKELRKLKETDG